MERTTSDVVLAEFLKDRQNFEAAFDDLMPPTDELDLVTFCTDERRYMLAAYADGALQPFAMFVYVPENSVMFQVHTLAMPSARGTGLVASAARASLEWMFSHTECQKVMTWVPEFNKPALKLALKVGMTMEGTCRKSFYKNGGLIDQYLLGISSKEVECLSAQV